MADPGSVEPLFVSLRTTAALTGNSNDAFSQVLHHLNAVLNVRAAGGSSSSEMYKAAVGELLECIARNERSMYGDARNIAFLNFAKSFAALADSSGISMFDPLSHSATPSYSSPSSAPPRLHPISRNVYQMLHDEREYEQRHQKTGTKKPSDVIPPKRKLKPALNDAPTPPKQRKAGDAAVPLPPKLFMSLFRRCPTAAVAVVPTPAKEEKEELKLEEPPLIDDDVIDVTPEKKKEEMVKAEPIDEDEVIVLPCVEKEEAVKQEPVDDVTVVTAVEKADDVIEHPKAVTAKEAPTDDANEKSSSKKASDDVSVETPVMKSSKKASDDVIVPSKKMSAKETSPDDVTPQEMPLSKYPVADVPLMTMRSAEGVELVQLGQMKAVCVRRFRGRTYVDLREYFTDEDGKRRPLKKGIALKIREYEEVKKRLEFLDEQMAKSLRRYKL